MTSSVSANASLIGLAVPRLMMSSNLGRSLDREIRGLPRLRCGLITALRDFDQARVSYGSFASDWHAPDTRRLSASLRKRTCANSPRHICFVPKAHLCAAAKQPCRASHLAGSYQFIARTAEPGSLRKSVRIAARTIDQT